MNNPTQLPQLPVPPNLPVIVGKNKIAWETDKKRNREVGHMLKTASLHRPTITRSLPHSRGR